MSNKIKFTSVSAKIRLTLLALFSVMLVTTGSYLAYSQSSMVEKLVKEQATLMADAYFDSINTLMLTGGMANRDIPRNKLLSRPEVLDARIVRAEGVTKMYGDGSDYAKVKDDWDKKGIAGEHLMTFRKGDDGRILTVVIPMLALKDFKGTNCLMCHPVDENSVLGAIRLDYSTAELDKSVSRDLWTNVLITSVVMIVALFLLTAMLGKVVTNPLKTLTGMMKQVAEGKVDYSRRLELDSNDEIGDLATYFNQAIKRFGGIIEDTRNQSAEAQRLKTALDNVSSGVMVADTDYNIIYMNKSVQSMLSNAEQDIRKEMANFSAAGLLGTNIDRFHKEPGKQRQMLNAMKTTLQSEFELGGRTLKIVANPVVDDKGERLGTAVEWTDRTDEVNVEKEIGDIVEAANQGHLGQRISLEGKSGFFAQLSEAINQLLNVTSNAISDISRVVSSMSQGDLTQSIDTDYQGSFGRLKDGINETNEKLNRIVSQILDTTDMIQTSSHEIVSGNNNLSARTEQEAASLEETASSMEELTATVRNNAEHAREANQLAKGTREVAVKGGDVVNRAVNAMGEIQQASKRIADIIGVIDEIAFQTNLLALNASVEAARAGEQGRGFAVVATEVRNLAQRSASAAKEIKELITDSVNKVNNGTELVDESGQRLNEIVDSVKRVGDLISEIAEASNEQLDGIDQVNKAVTSLDESTQQNAALAEETAAASSHAANQAEEMNGLIKFFTTKK